MSNFERLPQFIADLNNILSTMDVDSLKSFILDFAKMIPEEKRCEFKEKILLFKTSNNINKSFENEIKEFIIKFEKKQEEGFIINSSYNENYRYWSDDYDKEYYFYNIDDSLSIINEAIEYIHKSIDDLCYSEGIRLVNLLFNIDIDVVGDYDEDMTFGDLFSFNILSNYEELADEALYLLYKGNNGKNRTKVLYDFIKSQTYYGFSVENLLKFGESLTDFNSFLTEWINYLGNIKDDRFKKNLYDSIMLIGDEEERISYIYKYGENYNFLFLKILNDNLNSNKNEEMLKLGLFSLSHIDNKYMEEALITTASYAKTLKDYSNMNNCYFNAFKVNPNMINYLRIRSENTNYDVIKNDIIYVLNNTNIERKYYKNIMFFEGYYNYITDEKILEFFNDYNILLPIAILLPSDFKHFDKIIDVLENYYFNNTFNFAYCTESKNVLKETIIKLHENLVLTKNEFAQITEFIKNSIDSIVSTTIKHNKYNNYNVCSLYISSYATILENIGISKGKEEYINAFKNKYPTRKAFHLSLDRYI